MTISRRIAVQWLLTGLTALVFRAEAAHGQVPATAECAAAKIKCAANAAKGLLICHYKAEVKGFAVDPLCDQKVRSKFSTAGTQSCMGKAEIASSCSTTGDAGVIGGKVDDFVLDVVTDVDPAYPAPVLNRCSAKKKKCVATKVKGLLGCYRKAAKLGIPVDTACIAKFQAKFDGGADPGKGCFEKLEAKYPPASPTPCPTYNDTTVVEAKADAFAAEIAATQTETSTSTTVTASTTTSTTTIPTGPVACGDATAPTCDGVCPTGSACVEFGGCVCVPGAAPCGAVGAPQCSGTCPTVTPYCVIINASGCQCASAPGATVTTTTTTTITTTTTSPWGGWQQVPGGATTNVGPGAAGSFGWGLWLAAKGIGDQRIYVNFLDASFSFGASWSGWSLLRANGGPDVQTNAPPAVAYENAADFIVAVKSLDNHIWLNSEHAGWVEIGGTTDVSPALAHVGQPPDRALLAAKGIGDDQIYQNTVTYDRISPTQTGFSVVPGTTNLAPAVAFYSGPNGTNPGTLFFRVADDQHIHANQNATSWSEVPGGRMTDLPVAATHWRGDVFLFARAPAAGDLYWNRFDGSSHVWSGWRIVPGGFVTDQPVAAASVLDCVVLFAKGLDQLIYMNAWHFGSNACPGL